MIKGFFGHVFYKLSHFLFFMMIVVLMSLIFCIAEIKDVHAEEKPIGTAICTAVTRMNLRKGPSISAAVVGTLPAKATVNVYQISGKWYNIEYNGKNVWAHGNYLKYTFGTSKETVASVSETKITETADNAFIGSAVCTAKNKINLRSGPGTSYRIVGSLPSKTVVDVCLVQGNWYKISYNGNIAWGTGSYLSFAQEDITQVGQSQNSEEDPQGEEKAEPVQERTYAIYYQGDRRWGYSRAVAKKACVLTAYAIILKNMGLDGTPKTVYQAAGRSLNLNQWEIEETFGVRMVPAISPDSPYFSSFDGSKTKIIKPSKNYIAAVKEALEQHPEGVLLYFKRGTRAHAIVACKVEGDTIYYSDPGRTKTTLLTYKKTWVYYKHRLSYGYLLYMLAFDYQ